MEQALRAKCEPEDILQEVYLDVFQHIDSFKDRGPDSFFNWVVTILDSKIVNTRRALHSRKRDIARELGAPAAGGAQSYWNLLDQLYADSGTPSRVARHEEAVGALLSCISALTDSHRQVVQLRFLEGCSVAEAANRLGKSQAAVVNFRYMANTVWNTKQATANMRSAELASSSR